MCAAAEERARSPLKATLVALKRPGIPRTPGQTVQLGRESFAIISLREKGAKKVCSIVDEGGEGRRNGNRETFSALEV